MTVVGDVEHFLVKEFDSIRDWVLKEVDKLSPFIDIAEKVVNEISVLESSAAGQFLETTIEVLIPASTKLVEAFRLQLPIWAVELKWAADEEGKTDAQKWQDAVDYINSIVNPDIRALALSTLKALFSKFFTNNSIDATSEAPQASLTIQQSMVLSPPSHAAVV